MLLSLAVAAAAAAAAPGPLPKDIDAKSLSRMAPLERGALTPEGQRVYDVIRGEAPAIPISGPAPASMYSPGVAEPMHHLNQYLRKTVVGPRYFELAALSTAREFNQDYEWSGHEPAGVKAGLTPEVLDVVRFNRDPAGLPDKEATVIRLTRAQFREHRVGPELWARTIELFGKQGAIELTAIMGDYALAAVMLTAVDQHLPPGRPSTLPPR